MLASHQGGHQHQKAASFRTTVSVSALIDPCPPSHAAGVRHVFRPAHVLTSPSGLCPVRRAALADEAPVKTVGGQPHLVEVILSRRRGPNITCVRGLQ